MVTIDKQGVVVPGILLYQGKTEINTLIAKFNRGQRDFKFKKSIYGHKTVKDTLIGLQYDKCCFCERKVSAGEPGHVEHFRPKGGYKSDEKEKLTKPGYFWLAYDFNNLYFSCNRCNTSFKKNYFPLMYETKRAKNHSDNINNEEPLILNPSGTVSAHLEFRGEKLIAKNNSAKGSETIKRTGLNRPALVRERFEYLSLLWTLAKVANGPTPESIEARDHFKRISKKEHLFSYMVLCNFPDLV